MSDDSWIKHGSDWPEYEDQLVGNVKGLKCLRDAINRALECGMANVVLGNRWVIGVKVVSEEPPMNNSGGIRLGLYFMFMVFAVLLMLILSVFGIIYLVERFLISAV